MHFETTRGSFMEGLFGYLAQWHLLSRVPRASPSASPPLPLPRLRWELCTERYRDAGTKPCETLRCGHEFNRVPAQTATVGWFIALVDDSADGDGDATAD